MAEDSLPDLSDEDFEIPATDELPDMDNDVDGGFSWDDGENWDLAPSVESEPKEEPLHIDLPPVVEPQKPPVEPEHKEQKTEETKPEKEKTPQKKKKNLTTNQKMIVAGIVLLVVALFSSAHSIGASDPVVADYPDSGQVTLSDFRYDSGKASAVVTNTGDNIAKTHPVLEMYAKKPGAIFHEAKVGECGVPPMKLEIGESKKVSCDIDKSGFVQRVTGRV